MMGKYTIMNAFALVLGTSLIAQGAIAGNYRLGNYDLQGSRAIPGTLETNLTKENVKNQGLEVKWFAPTDLPVSGVPVIYKGSAYVGTTDLGGNGSIYAFNAVTGAQKWRVILPGGVIASPLVFNGYLYVADLTGHLYKMKLDDGKILQSHAAALSGFDSIWSGPIAVSDGKKDLIIVSVNPQDEFGSSAYGVSGVIAVNAVNLERKWTLIITDPLQGGSGIWGTSPAYSSTKGLIYVATGQTTINNALTLPTTSDAVYAIDVRNGNVAWKNQVRQDDIWNFSNPFDPVRPADTDIGDSPALFSDGRKEYVAMGSKRGYFYIMDAATGKITNNSGTDSLGYKKGLDAFNYSGTGVVGNSVDGGYNLDSGFYQSSLDLKLYHFGVLWDYKASLQQVADKVYPFEEGTCYIAGFRLSPECPPISNGNLVILNTKATKEVGRYTKPDAKLASPLYMNDIVFVYSTNLEASSNPYDTPESLVALDVSNPASPKLIQDLPLTWQGQQARGGGAMVSVSNGMIYTGSGFFGFSQMGLFAIGLKNYNPQIVDDN